MKNAVLTVRIRMATRKRLERLARREGRSLSGQVERLLDQAVASGSASTSAAQSQNVRPLAGVLAGGRVPTLADFEEVRGALSASLGRRTGREAEPRR